MCRQAQVVVNQNSLLGAGWSLSNEESLVIRDTGVLIVYGTGESRYFAEQEDGSFLSPPEDFGTLSMIPDPNNVYYAIGYVYQDTHGDQWDFDLSGRLTQRVDRDGLITTFTYDSSYRLSETDVPDGSSTTFDYSVANQVAIVEPGPRTVTLHLTPITTSEVWQLTTLTDEDGLEQDFQYDGFNRLTRDTWGTSVTQIGYDSQGAGTVALVNLGQDANNNLPTAYQVVAAELASMDTSPASIALYGSVTDALQRTTLYGVDALDRQEVQVQPDGATQTWSLDAGGQAILYTDAMGNQWVYSYDSKGNLIQEPAGEGAVTDYQYDPTFNFVTVALTIGNDGEMSETDYQYAATTGDLLSETAEANSPWAATTTYVYANPGLLLKVQNPDGDYQIFSYDSQRRQTEVDSYDINGVEVDEVSQGYDANGNLAWTLDGDNNLTLFLYDNRNQLVSQETYDANGNPVDSQDNAYRPDGLPTSTTDGQSDLTSMGYDVSGQQAGEREVDGGGTVLESAGDYYDAAGQLTRTVDGDGNYTLLSYNAAGRVSATLSYDANGVPIGSVNNGYDADGYLTLSIDGDGNQTEYTYDDMFGLLLSEETYDAGGTLVSATYNEYDERNNLVCSTDGDGNYTLYTYDDAGQA